MTASHIAERDAALDLAALLDQAAQGPVVIKRCKGADAILLSMSDLADLEFGSRAKQAKDNGLATAKDSREFLDAILYG